MACGVGLTHDQTRAKVVKFQDPILFNQARQGTSFLAIQPASQDREHHLESRRPDHGRSLFHGVRLALFPSRRPDCVTLRADARQAGDAGTGFPTR
jgi:hypothetical protein